MATQNTARVHNVPGEGTATQLPVRIFADGNISGPQLTKDLASAGLELGKDKEGNFWLRRMAGGAKVQPAVSLALDRAHLAMENADSMLSVCVEALRQEDGSVGSDVAVTIEHVVFDVLRGARESIHAALDASRGARS